VAAPAGAAAAALSLAGVLQSLICTNATVRQSLGVVTQAQVAVDRAQAQRQPGLTLGAGLDDERGREVEASTSLRLDWVLFDFGRRSAELDEARVALAATLSEQQSAVLNAVADGVERYTAAEVAFGRFDVAAQNLRTAQDSARVADARHGAGAGSLADKLQAQTALAQSRLEHSRAMSQWLSARGALAVAMGLPATQPLALAAQRDDDAGAPDDPLDVPALIDEARRMHPRVVAARSRVGELQARAGATRAQRWGSIGVNADSGRSFGVDGNSRGSGAVGMRWSIPLFDREVIDSRLRELQGQLATRGAALDDTVAQVELAVWQQAQSVRAEREGLRESRTVLDSAEAALRVAAERYRAGVGGFTDVLSAQGSAAAARLQVVEARSNLRRAQLRLAAAVGRFGA
jgi:outer membrane protein